MSDGAGGPGAALSAAKNLATNLATLYGTKRKKGLQGTCKVSFFGILRNRSERNSLVISIVLRRKIPVGRPIGRSPFNRLVAGSNPARGAKRPLRRRSQTIPYNREIGKNP